MSNKQIPPKFDSFQEFYSTAVVAYKKANEGHQQLDGKTTAGNLDVFGRFLYQDIYWKVDADTSIDKLDIAFKMFEEGNDPFEIVSTKNNKKQCLIIKGQPLKPKHFYVYSTSLKKSS